MDGASMRYATRQDWQDIMKNRSRLKMHELIERLGLRAKWSSNKRGKTNFDSPLVKEFVLDMGNVVANLPKDADELVSYLSAANSLGPEIERLLRKHGAKIWGRMGDREHLVTVAEPEVDALYYPRDLYFENEEDREHIRTVLHWWLGLKACNVIHARGRLDRERRKKEERMRVKDEEASPRDPLPPVPIAPAAPSGSSPKLPPLAGRGVWTPYPGHLQQPQHAQVLRLDTSLHSHPPSSASVSPLQSSESPIMSAHAVSNGTPTAFTAVNANAPWRASPLSRPATLPSSSEDAGVQISAQAPHPPSSGLHRLTSELGNLVSNFLTVDEGQGSSKREGHSGSPNPSRPARGSTTQSRSAAQHALDVDTLQAFRTYIYPDQEGPKWDEDYLLRRLEMVWRDSVRPTFDRSFGNSALFAARDRAFLTWIELRRHLADLERADRQWREEGDVARELDARVAQHKTLMSASRDLVRCWEGIGQGVHAQWTPEGLSADEILVQAFAMLVGESRASELVWAPMNVAETVRWLDEQLRQFAVEAPPMGEGLLYLRA